MLVALITFALAAALIVLLPGPDTLVVLRSLLRGGRRSGLATSCGILVGLTVWVGVAALGLAAVLRASTVAYDVLKVVGACYLVWLGVQSLRTLRHGGLELAERRSIVGTGFVAGMITNLLNPKVGVFFVTFLPGFVPAGHAVATTSLLFGAVFIGLTVAYYAALLTLAQRLTEWTSRPAIRKRMDALTGAVLIGFGIRLVTES